MDFSFHGLNLDSDLGPGGDATALRADWCAVLCFEGELGDGSAFAALDRALGSALSDKAHEGAHAPSEPPITSVLKQLADEEQFTGKKGQSVQLHTHGRLPATRVLALGAGKRKDFGPADLRLFAARAVRAAHAARGKRLILVTPDHAADLDLAERVGQMLVEGARLAAYQWDRHLSGERKRPCSVEHVDVVTHGARSESRAAEAVAMQRGRLRADAVVRSVTLARDLANEGPSEMSPRHMEAAARTLAAEHNLEIEVLGVKECEALGMGMYLAVGRASEEEPRFIHVTYKPKEAPRKRVVLIGKSVTFDSGGLSIKTTEGMLNMKLDMGGGATVLASLGALAQLGCPDEVHVICAACENMVSGRAYKLGDVLRSMAGKTVEINNTDAEGRLTLGDAITFANTRIKPDEMFDFATLTGAALIALGPHIAPVMSNSDALAGRFLESARTCGEEMWRMPLPERLLEGLKSDNADMKNTGERYGGCLTAGLFLKEFVGETPWVHVDMAGPVEATKEWGPYSKGATGFGVATIVEYLVPR